jgi:hypothetical protein
MPKTIESSCFIKQGDGANEQKQHQQHQAACFAFLLS